MAIPDVAHHHVCIQLDATPPEPPVKTYVDWLRIYQ
jgi:hypothetical protein